MTLPPPPPPLEALPAGYQLVAGQGVATVLADFDFEAYSEAGFVWDDEANKWDCLPNAPQRKKGLPVVGAAVYAEDPTCEVLSLAYDLKEGQGRRHWRPGLLPPLDLFDHIARGGLLEAWNSGFEYWIWHKVCRPKYGWPDLPIAQLRCAMAKSRAFALPGRLAEAGAVLATARQKDPEGDRLLKKFSIPRNPTKNDPRLRIDPAQVAPSLAATRAAMAAGRTGLGPLIKALEADLEDVPKLYAYNDRDIVAEAEISSRVPDLSPEELQNWLMDQRINRRGVGVDRAGVEACCAIIDQAHARYNAELSALTGGAITKASEVQKILGWLAAQGVFAASLDEEAVEGLLQERGRWPPAAVRVLEIRQAIGSAAVKKAYAMRNQMTLHDRLHDLFNYYGARTGRCTGEGPQPTNMPNSAGYEVMHCESCGAYYGLGKPACPHCGGADTFGHREEWSAAAAEFALTVLASQSLDLVEYYFGDAMAVVSGCLRSLFQAAQGHDLICSDYSAIEAVVLAFLAGEEWRMEVFRTHGKIYEMSAAKITGVPFEEILRYKAETGNHHPLRKKVGKVAELALGYGGWIGSWRNFDGPGTDDEVKANILAWRDASPNVVEMWGGQERRTPYGWQKELYGVEGMFIAATLHPGTWYEFRGLGFFAQGGTTYIRLLSGRLLAYHRVILSPSARRPGTLAISFEGWNTNPKNGPTGWVRMDTYGPRQTENIVQATARDLQWYGMRNLEAAGYPIVLHVYDEDVAEVPEGFGSVEEFERIMSTMPPWAAGWPVKASGGWRDKRYHK